MTNNTASKFAIVGVVGLVALAMALAPAGTASSGAGWTGNGNWQHGTGNVPAGGSGGEVWATNLNGVYGNRACDLLSWDGDLLGLGLPNVVPGAASAVNLTLEISHYFDIENSYDGTVLVVSTDGGATWTPVNGHDGYSGALSSWSSMPGCIQSLTGEAPAVDQGQWTSRSGGSFPAEWITETVDLTGYAAPGDELTVGFLFSSDFCCVYPGHYIESVSLSVAGVQLAIL